MKNCRSEEEVVNRFLDDELSEEEIADLGEELKSNGRLRGLIVDYVRLLGDLRAFRNVRYSPVKLRDARRQLSQRVAATL